MGDGETMKHLFVVLTLTFAPSIAIAQCNDTCFVGGLGTGGAASDGAAKGSTCRRLRLYFQDRQLPSAGRQAQGTIHSRCIDGNTQRDNSRRYPLGREPAYWEDYEGQCDIGDPECPWVGVASGAAPVDGFVVLFQSIAAGPRRLSQSNAERSRVVLRTSKETP